MPIRSRCGAVFLPMPYSLPIGSGSSSAVTSPSRTITSPSGLRRSEAIFATSLFGATPTEAVTPVRATIFFLIATAIAAASPSAAWLSVTSRKASSSDKPCTSGVYSWKMPNTVFETSL